jgi:hypothetical protein
MSKREPKPEEQGSEEHARFERMLTALFRVDKREIPKHEPAKRAKRPAAKSPES